MAMKNVLDGINQNSHVLESENRVSIYFPYHGDIHISLQELVSKLKSFRVYSSISDVFKENNNPLYFTLKRFEK